MMFPYLGFKMKFCFKLLTTEKDIPDLSQAPDSSKKAPITPGLWAHLGVWEGQGGHSLILIPHQSSANNNH